MTETSWWHKYDLEDKIRTVLADTSAPQPDHHFGRPFVTAYQLAIALLERYPELKSEVPMALGGEGAGDSTWSQYVPRLLSSEIKAGRITDIEGAFLAGDHLSELRFWVSPAEEIVSTLPSAGWGPSMFRMRG